jgi:hypothetical protein
MAFVSLAMDKEKLSSFTQVVAHFSLKFDGLYGEHTELWFGACDIDVASILSTSAHCFFSSCANPKKITT